MQKHISAALGNAKPEPNPGFPLLVSYAYLRKQKQHDIDWIVNSHRTHGVELLLDSGAFTAFNAGHEIALDEYMAFLRKYGKSFFGYIQLDKIQDPAGSEENLRAMINEGLKPIPVHVLGDTRERMDELFALSDWVALGGFRRPHRGAAPKSYIVEKMRWARQRSVHWLGYTNRGMLQALKPYSCDCSSWNRGHRYGLLDMYLGNGRWVTVTRVEKKSFLLTEPIIRLLNDCGFSADDFYDDKNWARNAKDGVAGSEFLTMAVAAMSWCRYILDVRKVFGTRLFLASSLASG